MNYEDFLHDFKLLNTVVVSENSVEDNKFSERLDKLMSHSAFRALFSAINQYSEQKGITKERAMREMVVVMKDLNELWSDYIFAQGSMKLSEMIDSETKAYTKTSGSPEMGKSSHDKHSASITASKSTSQVCSEQDQSQYYSSQAERPLKSRYRQSINQNMGFGF